MLEDETMHSTIHKTFPLAEFQEQVADYYSNMSAGKYILQPHSQVEKLTQGVFEEFSIKDLKTE